MPPPPPPPPPICLPFTSKKPKRRLSFSSADRSFDNQIVRNNSFSSASSTVSAAPSITFHSDSEQYYEDEPRSISDRPRLTRSNTMTGTKKSTGKVRWGYGWGSGKQKEKDQEMAREKSASMSSQTQLPLYQPPTRNNSKSTQASRSTQKTQSSQRTQDTHQTKDTERTKTSQASGGTHRSQGSKALPTRPQLRGNDSSSTLVGSALDRKINDVDYVPEKPDTTERLEEIRRLMLKDQLDYYIIPSEDAHQSEYVASSDKRRQYISGFTGSAGQAVITKNSAYLITDSRYWLQARDQVDGNWHVVRAGSVEGPKDWIEWLVERVKDSRIGIDARMIAHEKATILNSQINPLGSKLIYPPQNLVDLVWKDKPDRSQEPVYTQSVEYAGQEASSKIAKLREWIRRQPPSVPSYSKSPATPAQIQVATLITSLPGIAYLLNLRGSDVPFNPLFHAFLFVGLNTATIFLDKAKVKENVAEYLNGLGVERRDYTEVWTFLRKREWGEGKVLLSPQTPYAISLMLTNYRYTIAPSHVEHMMSIKNETELSGLRHAYLRDGASFVRFLAWLEGKIYEGYDITEYEAASRLTEFRRKNTNFMGLAYENISASGPNAALPHYSPRKATARMIDRDTPYLNDSGGQYRDGTCDTTRTVHFGRPDNEQCEAYTRVLQGHIAIDSAIFPKGTSGHQLDVLARKALWKEGLNYMHGTGHGFGSFLTVHEGPQSFSSNVPLAPGHVITNEPGFYLEGKWGIRIESALVVRTVKPRGDNGAGAWLGFERLTCVPIQTRMIKESMLTKEEKRWIKDHNQRCYDLLATKLKDDKRALKWLKREATRDIGLASAAPGGLTIDWD